jgi:antitoxin StbD
MEQDLASRSVSIAELKRSPSAVLEQAGSEPVAALNHNRPAAYLLPPHVYEAMLERLHADLRVALQDCIDSGPGILAADVFAELNARYAETATKPSSKRAVVFLPKSRQELLDIGDTVAKDSLANARRFVVRLLEQCQRIGTSPMGYVGPRDLAPGLRMAAVGRYVICSRVFDGMLCNERVLHGAINLPLVFEREK